LRTLSLVWWQVPAVFGLTAKRLSQMRSLRAPAD
jgi:hypothetical protein